MGFTYKYQVKDAKIRDKFSFLEYKDQIKRAMSEHFGKNLKAISIYEKHYDFKLYQSVVNNSLRTMGSSLHEIWGNFADIRLSIK